MNRVIFFVVVAVILSGCPMGCPAKKPAASASNRSAHFLDTSTAAATPKRIVSLSPAATEILFEVGVGDSVVGVTRYCDRPDAALRLPKVGGLFDLNIEVLLSLQPDLIIAAASAAQESSLRPLRERGLPIFIGYSDTREEIFDFIHGIGRITHTEKAATTSVEDIRASLSRASTVVSDSASGAQSGLRVLIAISTHPLVVAGTQVYASDILDLVGAKNAAQGKEWPTLSLEAVRSIGADVMVAAEGPEAAKRLRDMIQPVDPDLKVVAADRPILMRPGISIGRDAEALKRILSGIAPLGRK